MPFMWFEQGLALHGNPFDYTKNALEGEENNIFFNLGGCGGLASRAENYINGL